MAQLKIKSVLLALIILLPLVGCGATGGGSFTYNLNSVIKSLDPQTALDNGSKTVLTALFEGLCRLDSSGKAAPGAAESWSANEDFTSYTFKLRASSKWSNGDKLSAADFVFGLRRAVDPVTKSTGLEDVYKIKNAKAINEGSADPSTIGVSALDENTLKIDLEQPDENFPLATTGLRFMPCNEKFFESTTGRYGLPGNYLIANGPFVLNSSSDWSAKLKLSRNKSYVGSGGVKPESLVFTAYLDEAVAADPVAALADGTADVLPLSYEQSINAATLGANIVSFDNKTTGLIFNTNLKPLNDRSLRELFVKTIDRQSVLSAIPQSLSPTDNIIPDNVLWGEATYRDLVQDDMLIKGDTDILSTMPRTLKSLELDIIPSISVLCVDDEAAKAIANKVIISWNGVMGNYFNIQPVTQVEFNSRITSGDYQCALYTVSASGNTPNSFLSAFQSTSTPQLLKSASFDEGLQRIGNTAGDYRELERFLHDDFIFYPLHKQKTYYGISPKVKGVSLATGNIDFRGATK